MSETTKDSQLEIIWTIVLHELKHGAFDRNAAAVLLECTIAECGPVPDKFDAPIRAALNALPE